MKAWHFVGDTLRDGRPVPADGETLTHSGHLVMCRSGLHASVRIIDALKYASGPVVCRVKCGGRIVKDIDKLVCESRTIMWRVDATAILREFARRQALSVRTAWEMPSIVEIYLLTGDETIRSAAELASMSAAALSADLRAWSAAMSAYMSAADLSADLAALSAAGFAAMSAAESAAWEATDKDLRRLIVSARRKQRGK